MEAKELYISEVRPGIWLMDEGHAATGYLVVGEEKACVIDTMNGYNDLYRAVRKITDKPLVTVNTHGHPDHIFGNVYLGEAYLHPADRELARMFTESPEYLKILEEQGAVFPPFRDILPGDVIDLGGRTLEVFGLPGHTDTILHGHARAADDISLLRCLREGVREICEGKTAGDKPYQWFGGTGLQHAFRCDPDKHYQQEDHVICYRADNIG